MPKLTKEYIRDLIKEALSSPTVNSAEDAVSGQELDSTDPVEVQTYQDAKNVIHQLNTNGQSSQVQSYINGLNVNQKIKDSLMKQYVNASIPRTNPIKR